ncbi:MAG: SH3 domain-containing protein [Rickettsiales bacterium]
MKRTLAILMLLTATVAHAEPDSSILNPSGLPIPRFVSLKSDEVNVRVGPGKRYPIRYVYKRSHLPVQVIEEFAHWRKIADYEGASGWVHKGMIDGARRAMVMDKTQNLYADPDPTSATALKAAATVIGEVKRCEPDWCQMEIQGRKGWIRKADIWGVTREEVFKD